LEQSKLDSTRNKFLRVLEGHLVERHEGVKGGVSAMDAPTLVRSLAIAIVISGSFIASLSVTFANSNASSKKNLLTGKKDTKDKSVSNLSTNVPENDEYLDDKTKIDTETQQEALTEPDEIALARVE